MVLSQVYIKVLAAQWLSSLNAGELKTAFGRHFLTLNCAKQVTVEIKEESVNLKALEGVNNWIEFLNSKSLHGDTARDFAQNHFTSNGIDSWQNPEIQALFITIKDMDIQLINPDVELAAEKWLNTVKAYIIDTIVKNLADEIKKELNIDSISDKRVVLIKKIKECFAWGLKESKDFLEENPQYLK